MFPAAGSKLEPDRAMWKNALISKGAVDESFYCPSDKKAKTSQSGEWHDHLDTSYTWDLSLWFYVRPPAKVVNLDNIDKPSETILYMDQSELLVDESDQRTRKSAHGDTFNAVFVDGHAETRSVSKP
jgi:prepilin-type processing-associated H-X9-DG protein